MITTNLRNLGSHFGIGDMSALPSHEKIDSRRRGQPADRYRKPGRSHRDASLKGRASRRATSRKLPVPREGNRNVRRALVDVRQTGKSPHDGSMTIDFNYTLDRSLDRTSRLHATETRPRVCEPSGKAQLT